MEFAANGKKGWISFKMKRYDLGRYPVSRVHRHNLKNPQQQHNKNKLNASDKYKIMDQKKPSR